MSKSIFDIAPRELHIEQFGFAKMISKSQLEDLGNMAGAEQMIADEFDGMLLKVRQKVWAENTGERKTVEHTIRYTVPATPWDHFKIAYFPDWLLRRFPAKKLIHFETERRTFELVALFPAFNYLPPPGQRTVMQVFERDTQKTRGIEQE